MRATVRRAGVLPRSLFSPEAPRTGRAGFSSNKKWVIQTGGKEGPVDEAEEEAESERVVDETPDSDPEQSLCPFPANSFGAHLFRAPLSKGLPAVSEGFPQSREEAYRIQRVVAGRMPTPKAWRVSHTSAAQRLVSGVSQPIVHPVSIVKPMEPLRERVSSEDGTSVMYPEAIFRLGKDLPLRVEHGTLYPYTMEEIISGIDGYGQGLALERYHLGLSAETKGPAREYSLIADSLGCRKLRVASTMHAPPMLASHMAQGVVSFLHRKRTIYSAEIFQAMGGPLIALAYLVNQVQQLQHESLKASGTIDHFYDLKKEMLMSVALCSPTPINRPEYSVVFDHFFRPADSFKVWFKVS